MKVTTVSGVASVENVKVLKPVSKVFIKTVFGAGVSSAVVLKDPTVRIRLVDGRNGSSTEIVPETSLSVLSEIASKYEGFQRRSGLTPSGVGAFNRSGFSQSTVVIGAIVDGVINSVDLSNDKYLDIDLKNLNTEAGISYEIWGFEFHRISTYCRIYNKFYLSQGELEKTFSVSDNEQLVYPIQKIRELQLYAKNGGSPIYRKEELILDEDGRNDLVSVDLSSNNEVNAQVSDGVATLPIKFGYSTYGIMDIAEFVRFDVRREDSADALMFIMMDTIPTVKP